MVFNIENKTFKLLNFIVNCVMFVIYKCIIVRNFESKQYSFSGLQNMLHQELKNQICNDVKGTNGRQKGMRSSLFTASFILVSSVKLP